MEVREGTGHHQEELGFVMASKTKQNKILNQAKSGKEMRKRNKTIKGKRAGIEVGDKENCRRKAESPEKWHLEPDQLDCRVLSLIAQEGETLGQAGRGLTKERRKKWEP